MDDHNIQMQNFIDMMGCIERLYLWQYKEDLTLLYGNDPEATYWHQVFLSSPCSAIARQHCFSSRLPILLSDAVGILWIASPSPVTDENASFYLMGPVFLSALKESQLEDSLHDRITSIPIKRQFLTMLKQLPIIAHSTFMTLGILLHYCVTGQRILASAIQVAASPSQSIHTLSAYSSFVDPVTHEGGAYEALLLQMVEEGNLHYKDILKSIPTDTVGILAPDNALRQFQDFMIAETTLCCRAAIRGGLPRETALTLSDLYIQSLEVSESISDVIDVHNTMREEYIQRVHAIRHSQTYSPAVRACMDYIDCNLSSPLTVAQVAAHTGYAGYYISSLFKKEMQTSLVSYIQQKKIDYAKLLLETSQDTIGDLAIRLHFSSASHFGAVFRKYMGMTPVEYRKKRTDHS